MSETEMMCIAGPNRSAILVAIIMSVSLVGAARAQAIGRPAEEVGVRQAGSPTSSIEPPTARLQTRIDNRVATRLNNRLDRTFDPAATDTGSFDRAQDSLRTKTKAR